MSGENSEKTELIAHVIQQEGLDRRHVTLIGDRRHDIFAARANQIRSMGVAWGFGSIDELLNAGADQICTSISELVEHFIGGTKNS